jgi:hypothetical protein
MRILPEESGDRQKTGVSVGGAYVEERYGDIHLGPKPKIQQA